jgi:diguanylate cyclase (GGDEF)-like protein
MSANTQEQPEKPKSLKITLSQLLAVAVSGLVLGLILMCLSLLNANHVVEQLEMKSYDLRAQIQFGGPGSRPSPDVVVLQFDDASLNTLSSDFGVWPWPRDVHANMIKFLNSVGVKALLYDIMFVSNRKGSEDADRQLVEAFKNSNNVYLSMNLGNDLLQSQKLGKDLTPRDIEALMPLTIDVVSDLDKAPADTPLHLGKDSDGIWFYRNNHMTFDNYRSIMPSLLGHNNHIGIINHGTDDDGVSRGNPLFFRFKYYPFIKTKSLPIQKVRDYWLDASNHRVDEQGYLYERSSYFPVVPQKNGTFLDKDPKQARLTDAEGYLMDDYGHPMYQREKKRSVLYLPYLGLRAAMELKHPHERIKLHLTKDGHLKTRDFDIPLSPSGDFLVNWYNVNLNREVFTEAEIDLNRKIRLLNAYQHRLEEFISKPKQRADDVARAREEMKANLTALEKHQNNLQLVHQFLKADYIPQPYKTIPAWQVIRLMNKQEKGLPYNEEDQYVLQNLKNKIIFIGATAVATYDIKNTSLYSTMPGVILQANLFDNLMQNSGHYLHRVSPNINLFLTLFLCLLAAGCTLKMRSAIAGLLTTANIAIIYALFTIIAFHSFSLWIDIAMPLVCLIVTITITFMLKYFLSNKDYEKTYALATTDSMTGLYNHRFFQDHMRHSIEQSNRFKHKFSLLLIDIDFFKKFNDTYGHQAGDEVLRHVAKKLKKNVRTVDVVARYGGEEMAIILDRANEEEALIVANKIVKAIAEEAYPIAEGVFKHVTISCGVSTYPTHGETPSQMIEFSDQGLYRAKENGRNQVGAQYDALPPDGGDSGHNHQNDQKDHHAA